MTRIPVSAAKRSTVNLLKIVTSNSRFIKQVRLYTILIYWLDLALAFKIVN